jgi:hypothetical protein
LDIARVYIGDCSRINIVLYTLYESEFIDVRPSREEFGIDNFIVNRESCVHF